jgi:hypothetical protein
VSCPPGIQSSHQFWIFNRNLAVSVFFFSFFSPEL